MNFIYVIHWLYWKHLTDLIIRNRSNRNNSGDGNNKGERALCARPTFIVAMNAVVSVASVVYDQVSQLVPVQQVDDIDEVHQLDPVHQVDHRDEFSKRISLQK